MPFFKCIYKDLLTNLNVRFFFPNVTAENHPPTKRNETSFWKKLSQYLFVICYRRTDVLKPGNICIESINNRC